MFLALRLTSFGITMPGGNVPSAQVQQNNRTPAIDAITCDGAGDEQALPAWMRDHAANMAAEQRRMAAEARARRIQAAQAKLAAANQQAQRVILSIAFAIFYSHDISAVWGYARVVGQRCKPRFISYSAAAAAE